MTRERKPRRPALNAAVIRGLACVRAPACAEADVGELPAAEYKRVRRGIRYIDELRRWYEATHGEVKDDEP